METTRRYDVFVIGAGPGGYTAAILAAKKGLKVGIAGGEDLGGTCTNTGCIPTKTYIESVNLLTRIRNAAKFGIAVSNPIIDLAQVKSRKDRIVLRLARGIESLLKQHGVDIYHEKASLKAQGKIAVGNSTVNSTNIIIATGSCPKSIPLMHGHDVLTTDTIFDLTDLPRSLSIVGGGVIGMEMAHIFSSMDVKVTVIEALDRILPLEDRHVSEYMLKIYRKIDFLTSARITGMEGSAPCRLCVETPSGQTVLEPEKVLVCIGRQPVIPPGTELLGIEMRPSGGIRVDEFMQTSVRGLYAVGDVTGEHMYAYVASREAAIAVGHLTGGSMEMSYRNIPSIIFTSPEVASVGSRAEGDSGESSSRTGSFPVSALGRARTMEANDGYARITASSDGSLERVSIISPHATELIPWLTLALDQGLTAEGFTESFCPHPVLAELLKEAAEDILGMSVHKS